MHAPMLTADAAETPETDGAGENGDSREPSPSEKRQKTGGDEDDGEEERSDVQYTVEDGVTIREKPAVVEERTGKIEFRVVNNDNTRDNLIILTGLKNIFMKQLPKMPREYIARLIYDRNHLSMAIVKKPMTVVGGITYRPFNHRQFAEIVFCAISSTEQVRGYGAHLMNHLKDYVKGTSPIMHFLTYADNYAIGYFRKQGFTKEITLEKSVWMGYIKDYEGGTLMQCTMLPRIRYLSGAMILAKQKLAIQQQIERYTRSNIVHPGLKSFKRGSAHIKPTDVPGILEAGWSEEMDKLARRPKRKPFYGVLQMLLSELQNHPSAWAFLQPVDRSIVNDYYEVIKEPMDLATMESKLESDAYDTVESFLYDCRLVFNNCRTYNEESTPYYKNATKLEKFLNQKLQETDYAHLAE